MRATTTTPGEIITLDPDRIGLRYEALRIVRPAAEAAMLRSIRTYGQLAPVVVCQSDDGVDLIDGFKRIRACRKLRIPCVTARVLSIGKRASKAAMLRLNQAGRSMSVMEEAMIACSLHRDDGLSQVEIAVLLERHKSWVCRRIGLIERITPEVREAIKLGLVSTTVGRELSKLPRGNQEDTLSAIQKRRLDCRETARLVHRLLSRPRWDHAEILRCLWLRQERCPPRHQGLTVAERLSEELSRLERHCASVASILAEEHLARFAPDELSTLAPLMEQTLRSLRWAMERIHDGIARAALIKEEVF